MLPTADCCSPVGPAALATSSLLPSWPTAASATRTCTSCVTSGRRRCPPPPIPEWRGTRWWGWSPRWAPRSPPSRWETARPWAAWSGPAAGEARAGAVQCGAGASSSRWWCRGGKAGGWRLEAVGWTDATPARHLIPPPRPFSERCAAVRRARRGWSSTARQWCGATTPVSEGGGRGGGVRVPPWGCCYSCCCGTALGCSLVQCFEAETGLEWIAFLQRTPRKKGSSPAAASPPTSSPTKSEPERAPHGGSRGDGGMGGWGDGAGEGRQSEPSLCWWLTHATHTSTEAGAPPAAAAAAAAAGCCCRTGPAGLCCTCPPTCPWTPRRRCCAPASPSGRPCATLGWCGATR